MKPDSVLLHWIGITLACWLLSACEPSVGKAIERVAMDSPDRSTTITVVRYAEGTWGNPADGEHLKVFCKSTYLGPTANVNDDGKIIGQSYFVKKLGAIPKERITVSSNRVIYGTLFHGFFITIDGCQTVNTWNGTEDLYQKLKKYPDGHTIMMEISYFKAARVQI
jgi:hypothetical protein